MGKKRKMHLPLYGVGPLYGATIIIITILGIIISNLGYLEFACFRQFKVPSIIFGILVLIYGFSVWFRAAFRIDKYIIENELCTDGIYGIVRNPCYSGILLMCIGALLLANNLCLLVLPFCYWAAMTILMKRTEEKWLYDLYGQPYLEYCRRVNRCIPWFAKKKYNGK